MVRRVQPHRCPSKVRGGIRWQQDSSLGSQTRRPGCPTAMPFDWRSRTPFALLFAPVFGVLLLGAHAVPESGGWTAWYARLTGFVLEHFDHSTRVSGSVIESHFPIE